MFDTPLKKFSARHWAAVTFQGQTQPKPIAMQQRCPVAILQDHRVIYWYYIYYIIYIYYTKYNYIYYIIYIILYTLYYKYIYIYSYIYILLYFIFILETLMFDQTHLRHKEENLPCHQERCHWRLKSPCLFGVISHVSWFCTFQCLCRWNSETWFILPMGIRLLMVKK
jgi:hypothetical protein